MVKIIITEDFLYQTKDFTQKRHALWLYDVLYPIIKSAISKNMTLTYNILNEQNESFSRDFFYSLGKRNNVSQSNYVYNINDFNESQMDYLNKFFDKNTIVLGFELYKPLCNLLSSLNCKIIDIAYHPFKLFDDLAFGFYTNDQNVYDKLQKYKIPEEKFYYYANYWKVFMQNNALVNDEKLENNSIAFIGQTAKDKSVLKDGMYLNVSHFESKLKVFKEQYSKVYYLPHPYLRRHARDIYKYIYKCPYLTLLNNNSTYGILASEKIKKITGISTSVLYEAKYFNKEIEYLYKPLFNVDVSFKEDSYTSIFEDYWKPKFWADILSPICDINQYADNSNFFKGEKNKLRNIQDLYWGYRDLDPIKRIPNFEEAIKRLYVKYISQLI